MKKFKETGMVANIKRPVHHRVSRSTENIAIISDPNVSPSLSGIKTLLRHIIAQKVQLTHQLKPADHSQRRR